MLPKSFKQLLLPALLLVTFQSKAQFGFERLIQAGPTDAAKLIDAYGSPLFKGFGLGMNTGWNTSAQTLGLFKFNVRVTATAAIVPSSQQTFDVTKIGLSRNIGPADPTRTIAQSFSGNRDIQGPLMNIYDTNGNTLVSFDMPPGVLESYVPTPQLQLTVGLIQNTDFSVRAIPKIKFNNDFGSVTEFGLGVKHNFVRDFVSSEEKAPFDFALAFGYSRLNYSKGLNLQPTDMVPADPSQVKDFTTQEIYGHFDNYSFQAIFSKEISFFTPYISLGYNISKTDIGLKGNFPIIDGIAEQGLKYITYTNPVSLKLTHVKAFRGDAGFQLKFPVLTIYASYGFSQSYGMVNAGVGIGF